MRTSNPGVRRGDVRDTGNRRRKMANMVLQVAIGQTENSYYVDVDGAMSGPMRPLFVANSHLHAILRRNIVSAPDLRR